MLIQNQNVLVIGGTSGLGFKLATALESTNRVIVTGRTDPQRKRLEFCFLELGKAETLSENLDIFTAELPNIDLMIYAAGSYDQGLLAEMNDKRIMKMHTIYLLAPTLFLVRMLKKRKHPFGLIAISSISQWRPKKTETVYCSLKAGFGMLAHCLSLDPGIVKVLVIAPARIGENDEDGAREGDYGKLDPSWITEIIFTEYSGSFRYKHINITRDPAHIEITGVS